MPTLKLKYKDSDDRYGYTKAGDEFIDITGQISSAGDDESRKLAIINRLLAQQRRYALDHERNDDMFHGAAIIHTRSDRWYIQANIHLQNAETTRNCAEANAITEAWGYEGSTLEVSELWFMGGKANYAEGLAFLPGDEGKRHSPCGSCLDVILNTRLRTSGKTQVHMLPLNDGTMQLLPGNDGDEIEPEKLESNRILTRRIDQLLPHVTKIISDSDGAKKRVMAEGYSWIHDRSSWKAITDAKEIKNLKTISKLDKSEQDPAEKMKAINQILMEEAKDYFQRSGSKPDQLTIALVRNSHGQYFLGKHSKGTPTAASGSAELEAIGQMLNSHPDERLTDIFILTFDEKKLKKVSPLNGFSKDIEITMPDGATREIIKKNSPLDSNASEIIDFLGKYMEPSNGHVHVFMMNNPDIAANNSDSVDLFDPQKHVITMSIKELLPYAYQNPKGLEARSAH